MDEYIEELVESNDGDYTKITEIQYKNRGITKIIRFDNFVNLTELNLWRNKITKIEGLENLVQLTELYLYDNQIEKIEGLENLVQLTVLNLGRNKIGKIEGLENLVQLTELYLYGNQIEKIEGLENLVQLTKLNLSGNQIKKIEGLENLVQLTELYLGINQIEKIEGLANLVQLTKLHLYHNKITKIEGLENLVQLTELYLSYNLIKELPITLLELRRLNKFYHNDNEIEIIPIPVERWLERINGRITRNNMIYNDTQNIHNHNIQKSFRNSLINLLTDKLEIDIDEVRKQILESDILTEETKKAIFEYCDEIFKHSTYDISYSELLVYIWQRIIKHEHKDNILEIMNSEINDSKCMCFTGRLTRLLNVLVGYYPDIEIQISDSEQITNIVMSLKEKYENEELKEKVKEELMERNYSEDIIEEWIGYI